MGGGAPPSCGGCSEYDADSNQLTSAPRWLSRSHSPSVLRSCHCRAGGASARRTRTRRRTGPSRWRPQRSRVDGDCAACAGDDSEKCSTPRSSCWARGHDQGRSRDGLPVRARRRDGYVVTDSRDPPTATVELNVTGVLSCRRRPGPQQIPYRSCNARHSVELIGWGDGNRTRVLSLGRMVRVRLIRVDCIGRLSMPNRRRAGVGHG